MPTTARYRAYRDRKKKLAEVTARKLATLNTAKGISRSGATFTFAADDNALHQGLLKLREEIDQRRAEHGLRIKGRGWNPDGLVKTELIRLLDWIETELDRLMK